MLKNLIYDVWDEISDFFEDFFEVILQKDDIRKHELKPTKIHGKLEMVKPAYIFAERLDNFLKIVFGISIFISAFTSTLVGYVKLSDLLELLINHFLGRVVMIVIGASYLLLGVWKLITIDKK